MKGRFIHIPKHGDVSRDYYLRLKERFWNSVERHGKDECWPWTKAINARGVGSLSIYSTKVDAQKIAWVIQKGDLDDKACVYQTCGNKICMNPDHLKLETYSEMRARVMKGRTRRGHRKHVSKSVTDKLIEVCDKIRGEFPAGSQGMLIYSIVARAILDLNSSSEEIRDNAGKWLRTEMKIAGKYRLLDFDIHPCWIRAELDKNNLL